MRLKYVVAALVAICAGAALWASPSKSELPAITPNVELEQNVETTTSKSNDLPPGEPERIKPKFLCKTINTKWTCKLTKDWENDAVDMRKDN